MWFAAESLRDGGAVVVRAGEGEGGEADLAADPAAGEVVGLDVDAAPQARLTGLIGGVVVRAPLQDDVGGGAAFEYEVGIGGTPELAEAAGERGVAGDAGEGLVVAGQRRNAARRASSSRLLARVYSAW